MKNRRLRWIGLGLAVAIAAAGCSDDMAEGSTAAPRAPDNAGEDGWGAQNNASAPDGDNSNNDNFEPEEELFLVREVATTDHFVFVPNGADTSQTVARIDGRDFSVEPVRVGLRPTAVVAGEVDGVGPVAYVLSEGASTVAVIRSAEAEPSVHLLRVPREVNALALSPDGRHALAYIDPDKPLPDGTGVASLQTLALVRLGDAPDDDAVFELSVTRLIRDIEFTDDGEAAYLVGREGVNRLELSAIEGDSFIPPLPLGLSDSVFPPKDLEVEVSGDGSFMVVRSSQYAGLALYDLSDPQAIAARLIDLPDIPTDIDLYTSADDTRSIVAPIRDAGRVAFVDVDAALATPDDEELDEEALRLLSVDSKQAGLSQLTPDEARVLLYSTRNVYPLLGVYDPAAEILHSYPLRNEIRGLAVSPDGQTAVVIHERQTEAVGPDPLTYFQQSWGLTLVDLNTGYRRPVVLPTEPGEMILVQTSDGRAIVYVLLAGSSADSRGVMRVDLSSFRTDFVPLPRTPLQLGVVAGQVFVSQEADDGRITFFDLDTNAQRTVSGYELNAGID